ncbi:MAG: NAD-dependent succinate-semialdehyde dehydrogenase [Planctomycetaceae bacterium]|nr:NAD-dependent succinate-semialdehyde dehydrogenase [Planctomycetaceae bacterium]
MSHKLITTLNAHTRDLLAEYEVLTGEQIRQRIDRAQAAFIGWKSVGIEQRTELLRSLAGQLRESKEENSRLMTLEMGKPIAQAESEIEKCAVLCDFYAEQGPRFLQPEFVPTDATRSYIRYDPLGVILAVMPWNFPFWQVFRFAAPALMAGNTALLKHASNVTGCSLAIQRIFTDAGVMEDAFQSLLIGSKQVPDVLARREVRAVTLTGSESAGRSVAANAGQHLKKCVLELGGSDPFIVLEDADILSTAEAAVAARTMNSGQSCIAAKRFLVHERIYNEFVEAMIEGMEKLTPGDPLLESTQLGPQARRDLRDELHKQVQQSIRQGSELRLGGRIPDGAGAFYPCSVLSNVTPGMVAFDEELFGPVAAVTPFDTAERAIHLANQSRFGLGASIWTADVDRVSDLLPQLESGSVFVNEVTKSDPRMPFGGVKDSGYGRELSAFGIREFTNIKSIWVK